MPLQKEIMGIKPQVLITGSTGYVGGRLKTWLEKENYPVRCYVRSKSSIPLPMPKTTEYFVGDLQDKKALAKALTGVDTAYYLIQSMGKSSRFIENERRLATQFAETAALAKLKKIIYLGFLGSSYEEELSPHIKARHEIGHVLRANSSEVQVIEFRASHVIGSGSLSFDMIRSLVDKCPIILAPSWMKTEIQAIGVQDLITYLAKGIHCELDGNPIFEIGGKRRCNYIDLIKEYAKQKGVCRSIISLPFSSSYLSGLGLALITPLYRRAAKKLIQASCCPTVVHDPLAAHIFEMKPIDIEEAIARALVNENQPAPETRWNDAASAGIGQRNWSSAKFGGRLYDVRKMHVASSRELAFETIQKIGGENGYYTSNWLWKLRGAIDFLMGGIGSRRGRRDPESLRRGDPLDFWRVISYKPGHSLKLLAEIRTPGRAILEFKVTSDENGSKIEQKAIFDPIGIMGILYWYFFYPVHKYIFRGMIRGIAKKIEEHG